MSDFVISGFKVQVPEWANHGLEYHDEEKLKEALLSIPGAKSVTLYFGGFVEFESDVSGATQAAAAVEKICREHSLTPPAIEPRPPASAAGAENVDALVAEIRADMEAGGRLRRAQDKLRSARHNGYSQADDGSLVVAYFADRVVILGVDGLDEIKKAPAAVELPFLMREGEQYKVFAGGSGEALGSDWTGVCCDVSDVNSLWYVGRSDGERSFTKLQAKNLQEANLESAKVRESEAQEPAAPARLTPAHFDFLHWFNNTQFFRDDLVKDLVEAGEDELSAIVSASMAAVKSADVVRFVQEYAGNREVLQKFIQSEFDAYCRISKQPAAAPTVREDALRADPEMLFGHNKGSVYRYPAVGGVAAGYEWWATTDPELVGMPEDQDARDRRGARLALCADACRAFPDPAAEIGKLQAQAALVLPLQAEKVGAKFESMLYATLGEEHYVEAAARNQRENDPRICHTHDFCDANQVMIYAFNAVLGYDPDIQSEADMAIFDAAWSVGRERLANNAERSTGRSVDGPGM
jgi:hypothetical protein